MRYVIVGFGFLGSEIFYNLPNNVHKVIISNSLKNKKPFTKKSNFTVIDSYKLTNLKKVINEDDIIFFTSCPNEKNASLLTEYKFKSYLAFYEKFLHLCIENKVSNFIFFSSIKVYKYSNLILEDSPVSSKTSYAKIKLKCEKIIRKLKNTSNTKLKILRISNVFGISRNYKYNFDELLIPNMIQSIIKNNTIKLQNPYLKKDFITTKYFIKSLNKIIKDKSLEIYKVYNLGSFKSRSLLNLSNTLKRLVKKKYNLNINILYIPDHGGDFKLKSKYSFLKNSFDKKDFEKELLKLIVFYKNMYDK